MKNILVKHFNNIECQICDEKGSTIDKFCICKNGTVINKDNFQKVIDSGTPIECLCINHLLLCNLQKVFNCIILSGSNHYILKQRKNNQSPLSKIVVVEEIFQTPYVIFSNSDGTLEAGMCTMNIMTEVVKQIKNGVPLDFQQTSRLCYAKFCIIMNEVVNYLEIKNLDKRKRFSSNEK